MNDFRQLAPIFIEEAKRKGQTGGQYEPPPRTTALQLFLRRHARALLESEQRQIDSLKKGELSSSFRIQAREDKVWQAMNTIASPGIIGTLAAAKTICRLGLTARSAPA